MDEDVRLLHDLVAIPSVTGRTEKAAEFLVDAMRRRGFDDAYVDDAGNAVGVAGTEGPELLLVGHLDTVPGELPVALGDGWLTGRGSVDAKGPLSAFVAAAARRVGRADARIVVVGCCDEEAESHGARALVRRHAPRALVIGEPSGVDGVTIGYKGIVKIRWALEQDMAHTGAPFPTVADKGVAFWSAVQSWLAPHHGDSLFRTPTAKLQHVRTEVLPSGRERATLSGNVRTSPGFDTAAFLDFLKQKAGDAALDVPETSPAWLADKNALLTRAFVASIRDEQLVPRYVRKTGTSDANLLAPAWGCPTVAYGPGDSTLDHTPQERISIEEYRTAIRVLGRVLDAMS